MELALNSCQDRSKLYALCQIVLTWTVPHRLAMFDSICFLVCRSSQFFCHILGVPTVGMSGKTNTFTGQSLFCDVDMMCLAWITFGLEWIRHPDKWMSLEVYAIYIDVSGLKFYIFVHITSCSCQGTSSKSTEVTSSSMPILPANA